MFSKTKLALVGALVMGLGTVAQAGSRDDPDRTGGYRVGPQWQSFNGGVNPTYHRSLRGKMTNGSNAYAYVPDWSWRSRQRAHPFGEETYLKIQDRGYRHSNGIQHRDVE
jgi:hypothetical protein